MSNPKHTMKGHNFPPLVYISELQSQCSIARTAFSQVEKWAVDFPEGADSHFIHYCIVCISALAMISKLLFDGGARDQNRADTRRERLRNLLEISDQDFPNIAAREVRNSLEHLDERLDAYFKDFSGSGRYGFLARIGTKDADNTTFTPRGIDPDQLLFHSVGEEINLRSCMGEVACLDNATNVALRKLEEDWYPLWPD